MYKSSDCPIPHIAQHDSEREHHLRRSATQRCAGSSVSLQLSTSMGACNGAHPRPPAGRGPRRPSTSSASHHAQTCQSCCSVVHRPSLLRQQERQRQRRLFTGFVFFIDLNDTNKVIHAPRFIVLVKIVSEIRRSCLK